MISFELVGSSGFLVFGGWFLVFGGWFLVFGFWWLWGRVGSVYRPWESYGYFSP